MRGIATSQIVLLVLAIIVLAIIGYLVYVNYIAGSTQFGQTNCQSLAVNTCTSCKTCSTSLGTWSDTPVDQCKPLCAISSNDCIKQFAPGQKAFSVTMSFCKQIGVS